MEKKIGYVKLKAVILFFRQFFAFVLIHPKLVTCVTRLPFLQAFVFVLIITKQRKRAKKNDYVS